MTKRGRVLYVQYMNPAAYPPIEHSAQALADRGVDVLILGTDDLPGVLRLPAHDRIRVVLKPFQPAGWRQKLHYVRFGLSTLGWVLRWRPSWIYASDPLSAPIALVATVLFRTRLVYHEHDSPSPDGLGGTGSWFERVVLRARLAVAVRAEFCILPNDRRADAFRRATGVSKVVTVWNCPAASEVLETRRALNGGAVRVLYHGSIVPSRLSLTVIDAIAVLPGDVSLTAVGYETIGHPGYVQALAKRAQELGISDRVTFVGPIRSRDELMRHCATCDIGLSLLPLESGDINEREMVGASNKAFDYMACGLAVLVSDLPTWRSTFVESGFGLCCDPGSPESIAAALRWLRANPDARLAMGEQGRRKILSDWNYERQFAPVMARLGDFHAA